VDLGLRERVFLVTGGSRGLGYTTAQALVSEGARVVVSGREGAAAAQAAGTLGPGRAVGLATERLRELGPAREELADGIPLRRAGEPAEFGRAAAFVLSPAASYLTGTMLPVDGGALRVI